MNEKNKEIFLPLGIGLTAVGIIFGLKNSKIFFLISLIGIVLIVLSAYPEYK